MTDLHGARLSALARCPRWAAHTAIGTEGTEPDEQTRRYFARGQLFEMYAARQFQAKYGKDAVERQRPIRWGQNWTGHADIYVRPEKLLVEVFSTTAPRGLTVDDKIVQLLLYLAHDDEAEAGALFVINPSDLSREDLWPVVLTDERREEVRQLVELVTDAAAGGPMPACCKSSPTECRFSGCGFTEQAWEGWTPPPVEALEASPELAEALVAFEQVKAQEAAAKATAATLEEERRELAALLVDLGVPEGETQVGPFKIKRTLVKGRTTYAVPQAIKAGVLNEELLGPFMKIGEPHERLSVERAYDEALIGTAAFGDSVPF